MSIRPFLFVTITLTSLALFGTGLRRAQAQSVKPARAARVELLGTRFRRVDVDGIKIFYREAGDPSKPTILLLHGFPSSSHMFRNLLPLLAPHFHLVAPDYPGSGFSEAPPAAKFAPTFANLSHVMADFTQTVGLKSFTIYMQDFGGPVGFRVAVQHPERVTGLIVQNANAYLEGIAPVELQGMKERASGKLTAVQNANVDKLIGPDLTFFLYKSGERSFDATSPDGYSVDNWILAQPENHRIARALIVDYYDNVLQYPQWQAYLRDHQPKTLITWGKGDPLFLPPGAEAYRKDLPKANLRYFNTGHFALEEDAPAIAAEIVRVFAH